MGRHATTERRRGVAAWPIVAGVAALVVVAVVVTSVVLLNRDDEVAACESTEVVQVLTAPDTLAPVTAAAEAWNATGPVIRATCLSAQVTAAENAVVASALLDSGGTSWSAGDLPAPAVWVVDEETDLREVDEGQSALTAGRSTTPLATSPVVLAMAQVPSEVPSWSELAAGRWADLVLPGPDSRSTVEAAESIIAAAVGTTQALTTEQVDSEAALLAGLGSRVSAEPLADLLAEVTTSGTTVAVQESQLLAAGTDGPVGVLPEGATAAAEVYAVSLVVPWTSAAQQDAAAQFDSYLAGDGLAEFAAAGYRVQGDTARPTSGAPDTELTLLPGGDPAVRSAILDGLAAGFAAEGGSTSPEPTPSTAPSSPASSSPAPPSTTPSATPPATSEVTAEPSTDAEPTTSAEPPAQTGPTLLLLLDRSTTMNATSGDRSLNEWVQLGVTGLAGSAPQIGLGVWTCGSEAESAATPVVPVGPLTADVDGVPRTQAVESAMSALSPEGVNHTYGCLNSLWPEVGGTPVPDGQERIVVLVTAGVDRTPSLSRASLISTVGAGGDARLEIIGLDSAVNDAAMREIAAAGGGSYQQIDPADLAATLTALTG